MLRTLLAALGLLAVGSIVALVLLPHPSIGPLVLNLSASLLTLLIAHGIFRRSLGAASPRERQLVGTLTAALVPACNLVGLALADSGHALQVTLALAVVAGLLERERRGQPPAWLAPVLLAGPLLRVESLALSLAALALLFWRGHWRFVLTTLAAGIICGAAAGAEIALPEPGEHLRANLGVRALALLGVGGLAAGFAFWRGPRNDRPIAVFMLATIGAQLLGGRFGQGRYEVYVWATTLVVAVHLLRTQLIEAAERASRSCAVVLACTTLVVACLPYAPMQRAAHSSDGGPADDRVRACQIAPRATSMSISTTFCRR